MTPFLTIDQQSASYPVYVGSGLLDAVGQLVRPKGKAFVVTADTLRERYGDRVAASFEPAADVITINDGESKKTLETANDIVTHLLDRGARRDSMVVVVGGGMLGDTAGFAASIFLRGVDLVHVPTTLLAMVDSSIGGKVGVNHPMGKNLIGAFHVPRAVIADTLTLHTLPHRELLSGAFEALKGGVLGDAELFAMFEAHGAAWCKGTVPSDVLEETVRRAIEVKARIVSADEREADVRRLLNYGHTIGHGIEAAMHYEGVTHGEAVAWGMIAANAIAVRRGMLDEPTRSRIDTAIRRLEPRLLPAEIDASAILAATEHDKKNTGSTRVMVLPAAIGRCKIIAGIRDDDLAAGIAAILPA